MATPSQPKSYRGLIERPVERPRRLRRSAALRGMVRENVVRVEQLIYPLFVVPGNHVDEPIAAMPGTRHLSVDRLEKEIGEIADLGIPAVLLFGQPESKDAAGGGALDEAGAVARAIRQIKRLRPELLVLTDVCLCAYTDHGHCGLIDGERILNDESVEQLCRMAVVHARAGADIVAPSDMMDGRIGAIRAALDEEGHSEVAILSYAAKYASCFYGPFRDAAHSTPQFGDRRSYQMDPPNRREALREVLLDVEEGADMVMIKPALPYLDIIRDVASEVLVPVAAYQVSGEYSQIHAAAERGWLDLDSAMRESLASIRRAGADLIVTYFAKRFAAAIESRARGM
jgi:porphobilinogen synthase